MDNNVAKTGIIAGVVGVVVCTGIITSNMKERKQLEHDREELKKKIEILRLRDEEAQKEIKQKKEELDLREACIKEKEEDGDMETVLVTKMIEALSRFEGKLDSAIGN